MNLMSPKVMLLFLARADEPNPKHQRCATPKPSNGRAKHQSWHPLSSQTTSGSSKSQKPIIKVKRRISKTTIANLRNRKKGRAELNFRLEMPKTLQHQQPKNLAVTKRSPQTEIPTGLKAQSPAVERNLSVSFDICVALSVSPPTRRKSAPRRCGQTRSDSHKPAAPTPALDSLNRRLV
jgi:hypothetical protein